LQDCAQSLGRIVDITQVGIISHRKATLVLADAQECITTGALDAQFREFHVDTETFVMGLRFLYSVDLTKVLDNPHLMSRHVARHGANLDT
jgi:hypothetical protein